MYREIEFVCVNSETGGTPQRLQTALFRDLSTTPGVLVYRQDFSEGRDRQVSMAAIILDGSWETEGAVLQAASRRGVDVDLVNEVGEWRVIEVLREELDNLKDFGGVPPSES